MSTRDPTALFQGIVFSLKPVLRHDYTSLAIFDESTGLLKLHTLDLPPNAALLKPESVVPIESTPSGQCFSSGKVLIARGPELERFDSDAIRFLRGEGVRGICFFTSTLT